MRELLADDISLYNQLEDFHGQTSGLYPRIWEVPSLYCGCTALQPTWWSLHWTLGPAKFWPTAGSLFVRHSGMGAMAGLSLIKPFGGGSIFALAFACSWSAGSYHSKHPPIWGQFCTICREPDHSAGQCALLVVQPPAYSRSGGLLQRVRVNICLSWNQGRYSFFRSCSYRHICSVCRRDHRAINCPDVPLGLAPQSIQLGPNCRSPLGRSTG